MADVEVRLEVVVHLQDEDGEATLIELAQVAWDTFEGRHGAEVVAILGVHRSD